MLVGRLVVIVVAVGVAMLVDVAAGCTVVDIVEEAELIDWFILL